MNLREWIQLIGIIISTLGGVISAVGVVIVLPWWLRGKFAAQEKQIIEGDQKLTEQMSEGNRKLAEEISRINKRLDVFTEIVSTISKVNETFFLRQNLFYLSSKFGFIVTKVRLTRISLKLW